MFGHSEEECSTKVSSFSVHARAMADFPTPAGPLIQYIDEGGLADSVTQFVMSAIYCSRAATIVVVLRIICCSWIGRISIPSTELASISLAENKATHQIARNSCW